MAVRSGRRHLRHALLIRAIGARGGQLHRAPVGTRGSWLLPSLVHALLHVSTGVGARRLWSVGAGTCLLIALAAQQQIRLAAGLRDVAVAGTVVTLVLVALEEMLAQATDRLCVAEDPRVVRFLMVVDVVPVIQIDLLECRQAAEADIRH